MELCFGLIVAYKSGEGKDSKRFITEITFSVSACRSVDMINEGEIAGIPLNLWVDKTEFGSVKGLKVCFVKNWRYP